MNSSKPKKILHIYNYTNIHTGSPRSMIDLAESLDRNRYEPLIMTPREGEVSKRASELGVKTFYGKGVSLSRKNLAEFGRNFFWFLCFLKKNAVDLIHLNGAGWRESSVLAAKVLNIPVVLHIRNQYSSDEVRGNFNFRIAKKIIIISRSMQSIFDGFPDITNKVECIYNGIDIRKFSPIHSQLACRFQDKSRYVVIGYVGQISHRKGLDLLIKVAPSLVKEFPSVRFLVIGSDGISESGLTQTYLDEIERNGLADYFEFLGNRQDIPEIMNFIDLLVVPSRKEPFGKVIVEAMACKKCVIASDAGGIPEIIEDGYNGLMFPSEDSAAFEQCLKKAISDNTFREQIAENGLNTARSKFSTDVLIQNVQRLYASLI